MTSPPTDRAGISILELAVVMMVLSVVALNTGVATLSSLRSSVELRGEQRLFGKARQILDRVASQPFGAATSRGPSAADIDLLFCDPEATVPVTLLQLAKAQPLGQWSFRIDDFDPPGVWTVVVDHDLDGNGTIDAATGHDDAGKPGATPSSLARLELARTLVRVVVRFDGRDIIDTIRGREQ